MALYLLERKNREGFTMRIIAHAPCRGWRVIRSWWEPIA
jgi:hypothetical protein